MRTKTVININTKPVASKAGSLPPCPPGLSDEVVICSVGGTSDSSCPLVHQNQS